ncbi:hypothetical protein [Nonomuraea sp. NPDC003754]
MSAMFLRNLEETPTLADTAPDAPEPVKLTCVAWGGGLQNENWDILVQLNPDGTAKSAEQQGDAYMTGIGIFSKRYPARTPGTPQDRALCGATAAHSARSM